MINVHRYTKGAVKEGSLSDLKSKKTMIWVDCFNPSPKELKDISSNTGIILGDLKETVDEEEKRRTMDKIDYQDNTLILEANKGGDAFELIDEGRGQYTFQVGHCCVWVIRKTGTISEICEFLMGIAMDSQDKGTTTVGPWFSEPVEVS